ncbi:MAG: PQQ-dependent catabolism-associated CXXCW motif protein [Hyphomicrobiaceae bacterium]|nr:PQQ-dependent catabolism-associated CXXCW motif protein [Hyphomicrobiaceae bacterium]
MADAGGWAGHGQRCSVAVIAALGALVLSLALPYSALDAAEPTGAAASTADVAEPDSYRIEAYRAPVPATLKGARVVDTAAAEALHGSGALFIDVFPQAPKPAGLPKTTVWRTPRHETIKGAVWLPNVGYGVLNADFEAYFRSQLEVLTGNDKTKPIVLFCLRDCWMSWNAAKRALEWGYRDVVWFPDGTDGWKEFGGQVVDVTPTGW